MRQTAPVSETENFIAVFTHAAKGLCQVDTGCLERSAALNVPGQIFVRFAAGKPVQVNLNQLSLQRLSGCPG